MPSGKIRKKKRLEKKEVGEKDRRKWEGKKKQSRKAFLGNRIFCRFSGCFIYF